MNTQLANIAKMNALSAKWNQRVAITEGILRKAKQPNLSIEKRNTLVQCLENTQRVLESVQPSNIGQFKRFALDIVQSVVPNLIAYDLFSVQPINSVA